MRISLKNLWIGITLSLIFSGALKAFIYGYGYELPDLTLAALIALFGFLPVSIKHINSRLSESKGDWLRVGSILATLSITYSATLFYTSSENQSLVKSMLLCAMPIYYACPLLVHEKDFSKTLRWICLATALLCFGYFPIAEDLAMRRAVFAETESLLSLYLVLGYLCGICLIIVISNKTRFNGFWKAIAIIFFSTSLAFTGARGPILALIFSLASVWAFGFIKKNDKNKIKMVAIAVISIAFTGFIAIFLASNNEVISSQYSFNINRSINRLFALTDVDSSTSVIERLDHISFIANIYQESPLRILFGHGIGSYGVIRYGIDGASHPHNMFLEVLFEGGIPCFLLLVIFMLGALKSLNKFHGNFGLTIWIFCTLNAMKSSSIVEQRIMIVMFSLLLACSFSSVGEKYALKQQGKT